MTGLRNTIHKDCVVSQLVSSASTSSPISHEINFGQKQTFFSFFVCKKLVSLNSHRLCPFTAIREGFKLFSLRGRGVLDMSRWLICCTFFNLPSGNRDGWGLRRFMWIGSRAGMSVIPDSCWGLPGTLQDCNLENGGDWNCTVVYGGVRWKLQLYRTVHWRMVATVTVLSYIFYNAVEKDENSHSTGLYTGKWWPL